MSNTDWQSSFESLRSSLDQAQTARAFLEQWETETAAAIAKYARAAGGAELDAEAIKASVTRPYTLIPIDQHKALLVHWRGIKLPIFGWVKKQEAAFTISEVSRGMDLLTPFPDWLKDEMGWQPPEHQAVIEGDRTAIRVTTGDESSFRKRYGAQLGAKQADGTFKIKPGDAWIKLVGQLVKDGILPWQPQPVSAADWDAQSQCAIVLRDYQKPFVAEFLDKGAVFYNLPPGGGKTYLSLHLIAHTRGKVLILAPSVILCEQWRERVKAHAPDADVTILTYASGKKALDQEWTLTIFDEVQTLPADTFSKLAFLKTKYRAGLSASPWREDGRQYLIAALSGFPCAIRWSDLIRSGVLKRPRVVVATVPNDAAKTRFVQQLVRERRGGRALIFCDYLDQGNALANALEVPFVSGETPHKFERVQEAPVCVVSRIADRGLDFEDLTLVVEVAFLGKSREQEAQRLGRLLHSQAKGVHYLLFTPEEMEKFRPRIYGIEAELAGEVDIEFVTVGHVAEPKERSAIRQRPARSTAQRALSADKPMSELDQALANPAIAKLVAQAESKMERNVRSLIRKVIGLAWDSAISEEELRIGMGIKPRMLTYYRKAFAEARVVGLLTQLDDGRYMTDRAKIKSVIALSQKLGKR
ncbi:MAG: DEAD/DEAH box helicase family protein [Anaerolineae bacterium]